MYLRADGPVGDPLVIDLGAMSQGRHLTLKPTGLLQVAGGSSPTHDAVFCGIFSTSTTLLDQGQLDRVAGAIAPPADVFGSCASVATFYSNAVTDVANDFFIPFVGLEVDVPMSARYLFIAVPDDYAPDNVSPDPANYGVIVSQTVTTPEPTSFLLFGTGLVGIAATGVRRRVAAWSPFGTTRAPRPFRYR